MASKDPKLTAGHQTKTRRCCRCHAVVIQTEALYMSHASCTRRPTPVSGHTQQPRTALQPANLPRTTGSLSALCLVSPFLLHSISLSLIYTLRISPFRSSFSSAQVVSQLFAAFLNVPPLFSFYGNLNHPLQFPHPPQILILVPIPS